MSRSSVYRVDSVTIAMTKREPPHFVITAHGTVPTADWQNAELVPFVYLSPPADGIQEFCFIAEPPSGIVPQVLTPIKATYAIDSSLAQGVGTSPPGPGTSPHGIGTSPLGIGTSPLWVRGVRVHAASNTKEALLGEVPSGGRVFVKGTLTDEGIECQALRAESGELYTLAGDLKDFKVGDTVYVLGTVVPVSFCMQGVTITVDWITKDPPTCR